MPLLTRANVEYEVCLIVGRLMTMTDLYGSTSDGTNPSLNGPMRDALTRMGYGPIADPAGITVADADFAGLNTLALRRLIEWTELFVLEQVEKDWWLAESRPPAGMEPKVINGITRDPMADLKRRVIARIEKLRAIVMQPYQSMNVPISVGRITAGTASDCTLPPGPLDLIPPWQLAPDGLWCYGLSSSDYWGWGGFP